jgi:A/G-specific adenine glycosylase
MLAQTRVTTVIPYYKKFLKLFPDVSTLASSKLQRVLKAWEGLGYYARARNVHKSAQRIIREMGGQFPCDSEAWKKLPGVGGYCAAAIASFASEDPTPALDANVRRILARVYLVRQQITGARADSMLSNRFREARGNAKPSLFLQALMDLGQTICLPKDPKCEACPAIANCLAYARGWQNRLPLRKPIVAVPHFQVTAAVIRRKEMVLLAKRKADALLGGMWEFPGGKRERGETLPSCLKRELMEELGVHVRVKEELFVVPHAFSHFRITLHVYSCDSMRGKPKPLDAAEVRWVRIADLGKYPMGKADRVVASRLSRNHQEIFAA